jgi:hypothetical protein
VITLSERIAARCRCPGECPLHGEVIEQGRPPLSGTSGSAASPDEQPEGYEDREFYSWDREAEEADVAAKESLR